MNLNMGYDFNSSNLDKIIDLINAIDYIKRSRPSDDEIIKIVQYYEEF